MRLKSKIVLTAILFLLLVFLTTIILFVNVAGSGMADNMTHYSNGIDESKTNNLFSGYYKPLKDSLKLGQLKVKTRDIWYEKHWTTKHHLFSATEIIIQPGIHFIAPYTSLLSGELKVNVYFQKDLPDGQGYFDCLEKKPGLGYAGTISNQPDTLVLFFGTNDDSACRDTLTCIREENSR